MTKRILAAGGLRPSPRQLLDRLTAPVSAPGYLPPPAVNNSGQLTATDDQGQSSKCAGFAMGNVLEFFAWKRGHGPCRFLVDPIYDEAKSIDGDTEPGTCLTSVIQAAINLDWLNPLVQRFQIRTQADCRRALHAYDIVLAGFNITQGWIRPRGNTIDPSATTPIGGHAVVLVAYNSFGVLAFTSWGQYGFSIDGVWGFIWIPWQQFSEQLIEAVAFYMPPLAASRELSARIDDAELPVLNPATRSDQSRNPWEPTPRIRPTIDDRKEPLS